MVIYMEKILRQYRVWPGTVLAGKRTRITVTPQDYSSLAEAEYDLYVWPLFASREKPAAEPDCTVQTVHGCLCFEHVFSGEGEYFIRIHRKGVPEKAGRIVQVSVYAVKEDLYGLHPMKGDFHAHSCRSDGTEAPGVVAARFRGAGYDCLALTDHNRFFSSLEMQKAFVGTEPGLLLLQGEEVHTPPSKVHIVAVGGRESVAEKYVKHPVEYAEEIAALEAELPPEEYRPQKARALWATREIHKAGGIALFCHPYWMSDVYNVPEDLCDFFLRCGWFDAFELVGGQEGCHGLVHGNDLAQARFRAYREEGGRLPAVGNSDTHGTYRDRYDKLFTFNHSYTILFTREQTPEGVTDAIREGNCVAVHLYPGETDYHIFGDFRLVSYARYLVEHFFAPRAELLLAQGLAMEAYLQGDGAPEEIGVSGRPAQRFRERFFGRMPAPQPPDEVRALAAEGRQAWEDYGVISRGSTIKMKE